MNGVFLKRFVGFGGKATSYNLINNFNVSKTYPLLTPPRAQMDMALDKDSHRVSVLLAFDAVCIYSPDAPSCAWPYRKVIPDLVILKYNPEQAHLNRLASSMNGRFSSSVSNFHSAPRN